MIDAASTSLSQSMNSNSDQEIPPRKNLSASDLDPFERKKQLALAKVQAKLDKAQRLYQSAHLSVEQNISEFLRNTTLPGHTHQPNTSKVNNAAFDKRIRTLQETKKELERKIAHYQADLQRIQLGDIPTQYSTSKDILNNIKNKVASGTTKSRPSNDVSTTMMTEFHSNGNAQGDPDHLTVPTLTRQSTMTSNTNNSNVSQGSSVTSQSNEPSRSSPSNPLCNATGNSQFYIDANCSLFSEVFPDISIVFASF